MGDDRMSEGYVKPFESGADATTHCCVRHRATGATHVPDSATGSSAPGARVRGPQRHRPRDSPISFAISPSSSGQRDVEHVSYPLDRACVQMPETDLCEQEDVMEVMIDR